MVSSYDELIAGKLGNSHLTQEDYDQIDKNEMELIDIKWAFASAVRRAKDFTRRTSIKNLRGAKNTQYGFDMEKVECYNCRRKCHLARQCDKPRQEANKNPFSHQ